MLARHDFPKLSQSTKLQRTCPFTCSLGTGPLLCSIDFKVEYNIRVVIANRWGVARFASPQDAF
jgi:hypothetical protein